MSEKMVESSMRETMTIRTRGGEGSSSKESKAKHRKGKQKTKTEVLSETSSNTLPAPSFYPCTRVKLRRL